MTYIPLLALTVLTATATEPRYDLNILFNNGQTTVIPVEDIESIEFIHTDAGPTDPNFSNIPRGTMLQPDLTPGFSGSFFAPGVSATEGFVDVDKFGTSGPYGDDNSCCWMCAAADLIQWWLNDYKSWTGRDFRLNAELPSPSLYNGVAVMDAMMQAYNNTGGGDSYEAVGWFFEGVTRNSILNDVKTFNEAYPQWRGLPNHPITTISPTTRHATSPHPKLQWLSPGIPSKLCRRAPSRCAPAPTPLHASA